MLEKYENAHNLSDGQLVELLKAVGFKGKALRSACAIAKAESNGRPLAFNGNLKTGDSFLEYHRLISDRKKFNVIDLDPYGFPNRFFPDIFLLIDKGILFVTMPKPYVNILNGITQTHLICYYGTHNPTKEQIIEKIGFFGLCHWRKIELIDEIDCKSVWRFAFLVEKVKATEYTGVRNNAKNLFIPPSLQQKLF